MRNLGWCSWLPGSKRKFNEMVKSCLMDMNGLNTNEDLNILPLGSYDCIIGMDWLDQHHAILDCHNKAFNYLDEEGKLRKVQGVSRVVTIREISALQLKKYYRKGCQILQCIWKRHIEIRCQIWKIMQSWKSLMMCSWR
jgi:hypothetical protein